MLDMYICICVVVVLDKTQSLYLE